MELKALTDASLTDISITLTNRKLFTHPGQTSGHIANFSFTDRMRKTPTVVIRTPGLRLTTYR